MKSEIKMLEVKNEQPNSNVLHEIRMMLAFGWFVEAVIPLPQFTYVYLKRGMMGTGNQDIPQLDVDTADHTIIHD